MYRTIPFYSADSNLSSLRLVTILRIIAKASCRLHYTILTTNIIILKLSASKLI